MKITQELINEVDNAKASGLNMMSACKKVGIHFSSYYNFKKRQRGHTKTYSIAKGKRTKKPRAITMTEIPVQSGARFEVLLNGQDVTAAFIAKFLGAV